MARRGPWKLAVLGPGVACYELAGSRGSIHGADLRYSFRHVNAGFSQEGCARPRSLQLAAEHTHATQGEKEEFKVIPEESASFVSEMEGNEIEDCVEP